MRKVARYSRASTWEEALAARRADPSARWLAGGTFLLAGDGLDKPESVVDISSALPRAIAREGVELAIGAGATFQDIADSKTIPGCLVEAVLTMVNRNTRNRATVGGNIGADKSCSSLLPILLVLDAEVEVASPAAPGPERLSLERWLAERDAGPSRGDDLVLRAFVPLRKGRYAAYRRWNRVSCDLSVLGAAASFGLEDGRVSELRIALGGLGPKSRRFRELEALFEGAPLPSRGEIESAVAPRLKPLGDLRASAEFKRLRGAQLVADAILDARMVGREETTQYSRANTSYSREARL
jgi:probable selenate reductase FAD-binding subunit